MKRATGMMQAIMNQIMYTTPLRIERYRALELAAQDDGTEVTI
jgi:hypothetical protein